jgi:hypothetical protein
MSCIQKPGRGTLAQYAGRLHRLHTAKREVVIFDYVDGHEPAKMATRREAGLPGPWIRSGRRRRSVFTAHVMSNILALDFCSTEQIVGAIQTRWLSMRSLPTVPETNPKFQSLLAKSARSAFHCARNSCHRSPVFRMRLAFSMIRFGPSPSLGPAVRFDLGFSSLGHRSLPFRMNRL